MEYFEEQLNSCTGPAILFKCSDAPQETGDNYQRISLFEITSETLNSTTRYVVQKL